MITKAICLILLAVTLLAVAVTSGKTLVNVPKSLSELASRSDLVVDADVLSVFPRPDQVPQIDILLRSRTIYKGPQNLQQFIVPIDALSGNVGSIQPGQRYILCLSNIRPVMSRQLPERPGLVRYEMWGGILGPFLIDHDRVRLSFAVKDSPWKQYDRKDLNSVRAEMALVVN